jgi:hypothetical protein
LGLIATQHKGTGLLGLIVSLNIKTVCTKILTIKVLSIKAFSIKTHSINAHNCGTQ